jgi:metal transporter CNNM
VKQHLKHLGPSNAATKPKTTRINTVKIKPGIPANIPEDGSSVSRGEIVLQASDHQGGVGEGLLENAGREASDGALTVAVGYGTMTSQNGDRMSPSKIKPIEEDAVSTHSDEADENTGLLADNRPQAKARSASVSTVGSLHSIHSSGSRSPPLKRHTARSGSISENVVDVNGVKKIILETTSSSDSDDKTIGGGPADRVQIQMSNSSAMEEKNDTDDKRSSNSNKKKRKKRGKKKKSAGEGSENKPLLGGV